MMAKSDMVETRSWYVM